MSRDYELGFILNPEVNEEQSRAILERVEQIVATYGGQITRVNQWGRRRLAYPIEHHRDGVYVFIDMVLTPETVSELDRNLKVSEEVLRHLIKRRDSRIVQKEREEREEREARAAAAAQAQAAAPEGEAPATLEEGEGTTATPEEKTNAGEEQEVLSASEENEIPVALSAEENDYVPPAIEEETIEA